MTISNPNDLIRGSVKLGSLPEMYRHVNNMIDSPHHSAADIGRVIGKDPALTSRLLKIVNSPFYGFPSKIDTVSRAITIIGVRELNSIILASSIVKAFDGLPEDLINMDSFWKHSTYCAVVSRILAVQLHEANTERYFLMGLLHDIGSLLMYHKIPGLACLAVLRSETDNIPIHTAELKEIGFDHAEVGAKLLSSWNLPENIIEAVAHHHTPDSAKKYSREATVVHLANSITNNTYKNRVSDSNTTPIDTSIWHMIGLPDESLEPTILEADRQFNEALDLVYPASNATTRQAK